MDKNVKIFISVIGILIIGIVAAVILRGSATPQGPGKYDDFAKCIKDSGAKFYGAFWCPHCQGEKKLFGSSARYLPYIECSTSDGQGQFQICKDANIKSYPTCVLKDDTILPTENYNVVSLKTLAAKTGCVL